MAIGIPSIKATLSDHEYALITSVAGANFGEPLRLPPAALWLEEHYAAAAQAEDANEPDQADSEQSGSIPVGAAPTSCRNKSFHSLACSATLHRYDPHQGCVAIHCNTLPQYTVVEDGAPPRCAKLA